ncbi:hypothetical protein ABVT39_012998 [Epinephelus coioides]
MMSCSGAKRAERRELRTFSPPATSICAHTPSSSLETVRQVRALNDTQQQTHAECEQLHQSSHSMQP